MDQMIKILVVDDEKVIRDGCHRVLTGRGYHVLAAENGQEAMVLLEKESIDLILLDLNMPRMNGTEFLKTIKADEALKKIPVIVLTTSNSEQDIARSFELGAAGYMVKSVDYKKFTEIIKTIDLYWTLSELPA